MSQEETSITEYSNNYIDSSIPIGGFENCNIHDEASTS